MNNEEIQTYVKVDSKSKLLRAGGVWLILVISVWVMIGTVEPSTSIWFTLASGLVVSTIFTLMLVVLPEQWKKDKTVAAMLHIPSFILEAENGGFHTWSKNQVYCDLDTCSLDNVLEYKKKVTDKSFNAAQINITLQHSSEALHLFENSIPAAMSLSSGHGLFWVGMTSSIKKLSDVYEHYRTSLANGGDVPELYYIYGSELLDSLADEHERDVAELYYLYTIEFVESLELFLKISEKKSLLFRLLEMCKSHKMVKL